MRLLRVILSAGFIGALPAAGTAVADAEPCTAVEVLNDTCPVWQSAYDGEAAPATATPSAPDHQVTAMALSADGATAFLAGRGFAPGTSTYGMVIVAYNAATGAQRWATRVDVAGEGNVPSDLAESPDGSTLYVTGSGGRPGASGDDAFTVGLEAATGTKTWEWRWDGGGAATAGGRSVAVSPDGERVYVAGSAGTGTPAGSDYAAAAYDLVEDEVLWEIRYNGTANDADVLNDLVRSADGATLFVTGESKANAVSSDVATLAIAADTGSIRWARRRDGGASMLDAGKRLALSPDGASLFVAAASGQLPPAPPSAGNTDYGTLAYDSATGAERWFARYRGPTQPAAAQNVPMDIAVDDRGQRVFVTGRSAGTVGSDHDVATVAYDIANGAQAWAARSSLPGHGDEYGAAIAYAQGQDRVYVVGSSSTSPTAGAGSNGRLGRIVSLGYDAGTGTQVWAARYGTRADDPNRAHDLDAGAAVAVHGGAERLFVAGTLGRRTAAGGTDTYDFDLGVMAYDLPGAGRATPDAGGWASHNVEFVAHVPTNSDTAGAKIVGKYLYVTTSQHLKIYDISDPVLPVPVGVLALPAEEAPYFAEEDPDTNGRILLFGSKVVDVTDKANPRIVGTHTADGHTITCVLDCTYGYASHGPIVDLRNPAAPTVVGNWAIGKPSNGSHDVTEVAPGLVVTSSQPVMVLDARQTPANPTLIAQAPKDNAFIHSNLWPHQATDRFLLTSGEGGPSVNCGASKTGAFRVWDTTNWQQTGTFKELDSFAPANGAPVKGGAVADLFCSHWFDPHPKYRDGGLIAWAYYEHGTRLVRVSSAGKISEVGYYIPFGGSTSAAYWANDEIIYSLDYNRGFDILRYTGRS